MRDLDLDAGIVSNFIVIDTGYRTLPDHLICDLQKYLAIDDSECIRPATVRSAIANEHRHR